MSTVAGGERYVTVTCVCGSKRQLTARQARRAGRCPMCRWRRGDDAPTPAQLRFWLDVYSDDEQLANLLAMLSGAEIRAERVHEVRVALCGEPPRPERVLSSVALRARAVEA